MGATQEPVGSWPCPVLAQDRLGVEGSFTCLRKGYFLLGDLEASCPTSYGQVLHVFCSDMFIGCLFIFAH